MLTASVVSPDAEDSFFELVSLSSTKAGPQRSVGSGLPFSQEWRLYTDTGPFWQGKISRSNHWGFDRRKGDCTLPVTPHPMKPKSWPLDGDISILLLNEDDRFWLEAVHQENLDRQGEESEADWNIRVTPLDRLVAKVKYGVGVVFLSTIGFVAAVGAAEASGIFPSVRPVQFADAGDGPQLRAAPAK